MGLGSKGAFGWPGAFGTWWQADPSLNDMVLIYLIQNSLPLGPEMASQLATGQRLGSRMALPEFQRLVHAAIATETSRAEPIADLHHQRVVHRTLRTHR